jgi:hypothetical protein
MPIRPELRPHWRELSSHVRFERAGRRGSPARWPDLMEATRFRMTRVVLAAAHLDSDPTNSAEESARALSALPHAARSAATIWRSAGSLTGGGWLCLRPAEPAAGLLA